MRFGLMSIPGSGSTAMAELRPAEGAGVDVIATADHLRHPRDARLPLLDGWSVAAAWAGAFRGSGGHWSHTDRLHRGAVPMHSSGSSTPWHNSASTS
jgi:hypothetical protein